MSKLVARKLVCWGFSICYRTHSIKKYECETKSCIRIEVLLETGAREGIKMNFKKIVWKQETNVGDFSINDSLLC